MKTFKIASYLLALTGIAALAVADGTPHYIILALSSAPVSWWVVEVRGRGLRRSIVPLIAGFIIFFAVMDSIFISGAVLLGLAHLLLLVQILKLFQVKENKDYLQMYAISLVHLLVASVLTTDFLFAVFFVVYIVLATWAMMLLHLKKASEKHGLVHKDILSRRLFVSTSMVIIFAFISTAVFFILIPRVGMGFNIKPLKLGHLLSGFSERIQLGDIGRIKKDSRVVMRVELFGGEPDMGFRPLWRGKVYDQYNEGHWNSADSRGYQPLRRYGEKIPLPLQVRTDGAKVIKYGVQLEGMDSRILFLADSPAAVSIDAPYLFTGSGGTIYTPKPHSESTKYVAYSLAPDRHVKYQDIPAGVQAAYLQLPYLDDRVKRLAAEVASGGKDNYDKARLIEDYLLGNYGYTLELTTSPDMDPIEYFLFQRKKGNCEYFASAMVLMLRSVGIPARMVGGFKGGEWNRFGNYYLVRQSDAHTWVEAYLPPAGWLSFDPTPAEGAPAIRLPEFVKVFQRMLDALRWRWQSHVIAFDIRDQRMLYFRTLRGVREAGQWGASLKERLRNVMEAVRGVKLYPFFIIVIAIAAAFSVAFLLRSVRGLSAGPAGTASVSYYRKYLRIMARKGFHKHCCDTPREFARRAISEGGEQFGPTERITDIYYRFRYGAERIDEKELREIDDLIDKLKKAAPV